MTDWKKAVCAANAPMSEAIRHIDSAGCQLAIVLDGEGRLAGLVSDGDVRRAILRGCGLDTPASEVMNASPTTALATASKEELLALMRRKVLRQIPLLNERGQVVGLATVEDLVGVVERPNWVVLMAGGMGTRLRPLTESTPKPMLCLS